MHYTYTGQKNKFTIRTVGSGSGFLAVFIDGPSKAALSCKEVDEGYEFSYTPFAPGKYLISIKYSNIQIAGSPYAANITGKAIMLSKMIHSYHLDLQDSMLNCTV